MDKKLITPEGTKDLLFEDCLARRAVEEQIKNVLSVRGYSEVITPTLEFYDAFHSESYEIPQEQMYKLTDLKGRLLVLKPDLTIPIARLAATRLKGHSLPIRLYYNQFVYRNAPALSGGSDEVAQIGIELIGASNKKADLEVLVTAIEAMRACGLKDFRLELGHIAYFNTLIGKLDISKEEKEQIRQLIEFKNYPALNDRLDKLEDRESAMALKQLPAMFGGKEVFAQADALFENEYLRGITAYLKSIYDLLSSFGMADQISVDLGIVNRNDYYTGIVFQGYIQGLGATALVGGRYDKLLSEYGMDLPAVGFGIDVDALAKVMEFSAPAAKNTLIYAQEGWELKGLDYLKQYQNAEYSLDDSLENAERSAKEKGFSRLIVVGETIREVLL